MRRAKTAPLLPNETLGQKNSRKSNLKRSANRRLWRYLIDPMGSQQGLQRLRQQNWDESSFYIEVSRQEFPTQKNHKGKRQGLQTTVWHTIESSYSQHSWSKRGKRNHKTAACHEHHKSWRAGHPLADGNTGQYFKRWITQWLWCFLQQWCPGSKSWWKQAELQLCYTAHWNRSSTKLNMSMEE